MNFIPLKTIITKEMKILVSNKRFSLEMIVFIIFIVGFFYYINNKMRGQMGGSDPIFYAILQGMIIMLLAMFSYFLIAQCLGEMDREKVTGRIESILSSPISKYIIVQGKLISIFIMYYIVLALVIICLSIIFPYFLHIQLIQIITFEFVLMILVVLPLLIGLFSSIIIWLSLRFKSQVAQTFLSVTFFIVMGIIGFHRYLSSLGINLFEGIAKGNLITPSILSYLSLILVIGFFIMYFAFKILSKEKIIR